MKYIVCLFVVSVVASCNHAGSTFEDGEAAYSKGDYSSARLHWSEAADRGDRHAQHALGLMYLNGNGVEKDAVRALELLEASAEQGLNVARSDLGQLYLAGVAVEKHTERGVQLLETAASDEYLPAATILADEYLTGLNVPRDCVKALNWLRYASDLGESEAQYRLGMALYRGECGSTDDAEASHLFHLAAKEKHSAAQRQLAVLYAQGRGVPKDRVKAYMWLRLASPDVPIDVDETWTQADIDEGERLAREWLERTGDEPTEADQR